jgi:uncharacterized protein
MRRYLNTAIVAGLFAMGSAAHAAPSFDCNRAETKTEIAICGSSPLADADSQMANLFTQLKSELPPDSDAGSKVLAEQKKWLGSLGFCNGEQGCLLGEYQARISQLNMYLSQIHRANQTTSGSPQPSTQEMVQAYADQHRAPAGQPGGVTLPSRPSPPSPAATAAAAPAPPLQPSPIVTTQSAPINAIPLQTSDDTTPHGRGFFGTIFQIIGGLFSLIGTVLGSIAEIIMALLLAAVLAGIVGIPFIVAHRRGHAYKWVILAISFLIPIGWIIALIWAVFPDDKSLLDPILGSLTGLGRRNAGDAFGAAKVGVDRGSFNESTRHPDETLDHFKINRLAELASLKDKGMISEDEYQRERAKLL